MNKPIKLLHPTEKYATEIENSPCKNCGHFDDNHLIHTDGDLDIWVDTENPNAKVKQTLKEWKGGFKCTYNGIEALNPTELTKGVCKHKP